MGLLDLVESTPRIYAFHPPASAKSTMPAPVAQPRTLYDKIWDDHVMSVAVPLARRVRR